MKAGVRLPAARGAEAPADDAWGATMATQQQQQQQPESFIPRSSELSKGWGWGGAVTGGG